MEDPTTRSRRPAPSSHGHQVGPPVSASVPGVTETAAEAPFGVVAPFWAVPPVLVEPVPAEFDAPVAAASVAETWNGAENKCGLVRSF
jgi:hypothetical protein